VVGYPATLVGIGIANTHTIESTLLSEAHGTTRIGLALGSGASRGWSHIGVINTLLQEGIEPDVVCGTSVGAMIGASYLAGNLDKLEKWVLGSTRADVLRFFDIRFSHAGLVDADRLSRFLHSYVAEGGVHIEDLPKKYAAVSTNLDTGREVWFSEGGVADAVRASMAMPGLFPPVHHDHAWLVDGGLVNPVPIATCRALGAEVVIAVNLNSDIIGKRTTRATAAAPASKNKLLANLKRTAIEYSSAIFPNNAKDDDAPGLYYAIANSINIVQDQVTRSRLAGDPADVLISPKLAHIGMLEFHRAKEAIEEGEMCVRKALNEIRAAVDPC
jgi:NTE family protein